MRMKMLLLDRVLSLGVVSFGQDADSPASNRQDLSALNGQHEPPMLGIHWARGFNPFARPVHKGHSPNITYHGGANMPSTDTDANYWGPSWNTNAVVGDRRSGLDP